MVLFWNKRSKGVPHWSIGVEVNYDCGMTLYAPNENEKAGVQKEQGCGTICGHKCGKNIANPTYQCDSLNFGGWKQC